MGPLQARALLCHVGANLEIIEDREPLAIFAEDSKLPRVGNGAGRRVIIGKNGMTERWRQMQGIAGPGRRKQSSSKDPSQPLTFARVARRTKDLPVARAVSAQEVGHDMVQRGAARISFEGFFVGERLAKGAVNDVIHVRVVQFVKLELISAKGASSVLFGQKRAMGGDFEIKPCYVAAAPRLSSAKMAKHLAQGEGGVWVGRIIKMTERLLR